MHRTIILKRIVWKLLWVIILSCTNASRSITGRNLDVIITYKISPNWRTHFLSVNISLKFPNALVIHWTNWFWWILSPCLIIAVIEYVVHWRVITLIGVLPCNVRPHRRRLVEHSLVLTVPMPKHVMISNMTGISLMS